MSDQEARAATNYPIEIEFPDISAFAKGNCGVPWVYSYRSGEAGPHVMINALTHGNEVCGAIVVKELLELGLRPQRGALTLAFANVDAYRSFDPAQPDRARFVDQDLNRVWSAQMLEDSSRDSSELRRARELRPLIDQVDLLLDIHSMHERSAPLLLSGALEKGIELATRVALPGHIIVDEGHSEGCRLRDYGAFGEPNSSRNALLVECGQHWERDAPVTARQCTARFLEHSGVIAQDALPTHWWGSSANEPAVIRITHAITARSMDFRFAQPYSGLECLPEAGTVIGWDGDRPVITPYDHCVLVMPSLRQLRPGVTVVRFGRQTG